MMNATTHGGEKNKKRYSPVAVRDVVHASLVQAEGWVGSVHSHRHRLLSRSVLQVSLAALGHLPEARDLDFHALVLAALQEYMYTHTVVRELQEVYSAHSQWSEMTAS